MSAHKSSYVRLLTVALVSVLYAAVALAQQISMARARSVLSFEHSLVSQHGTAKK